VDVARVQAVLRDWFARWGLPQQLRLDNGAPWGGWNDLPPALALWLLGLGIELVWNRPGHKQGNAVVERAHGVCQRWVEAHTCHSPAEVQARLDWATTVQRERYPVHAGASRLAHTPALARGGRPYDPAQEAQHWDERRVWTFLERRVLVRRVDQVGRLSLANRALGVGRAWAGQVLTVRLGIQDDLPVWRISDQHGTLLRQHPAPELSRARILALDVAHRRPPRHRPGQPSAQDQG
jgi:hypothetical protein